MLPLVSDVKDKVIVIDTNVFIYYAKDGFKERSGDILKKLIDNGNSLVISEITGYELLRETDKDLREKFVEVLTFFKNVPISKGVLQNSAIVSNAVECQHGSKKVPLPDIIISGTAFGLVKNDQNEAYILTCDKDDFREPLWLTAAYSPVEAKKENQDNKFGVDHLYLVYLNKYLMDKHIKTVQSKS